MNNQTIIDENDSSSCSITNSSFESLPENLANYDDDDQVIFEVTELSRDQNTPKNELDTLVGAINT